MALARVSFADSLLDKRDTFGYLPGSSYTTGESMDIDDFREAFDKRVREHSLDWRVQGLLAGDIVYPLGSDTKVLSTVFELLCAPIVGEIAKEREFDVEEAPQTIYPDFTLVRRDEPKIAIDIKTTYRRDKKKDGQERSFRYTLGSYTSFLRNGTKNILYPYSEYGNHWIIGFLYSRTDYAQAPTTYLLKDRHDVPPPYKDADYFVQEKYKIVGETPASGNTTNIGSFPTANIQDLRNGSGPFAHHGKDFCDEYWRNFGRNASERPYSRISEFQKWRSDDPGID